MPRFLNYMLILLMPIVIGVVLFSAVLLVGRLFVILAKRYAASDRHWAYATVGTILRLLLRMDVLSYFSRHERLRVDTVPSSKIRFAYLFLLPCLAALGFFILCDMRVPTPFPLYGWSAGCMLPYPT